MKIGLFSYHAEFSTAEYFAKAIRDEGHELIRIGAEHPRTDAPPAPEFAGLIAGRDLDLLFFVDPPGPVWPIGWEALSCPIAGYLIDVHQNLDIRLLYAPFLDRIFIAQRDYVGHFTRSGFPNAEWLPLACDPDVHFVPGVERTIDLGFVGKLGGRATARHETLAAVLSRYRTNDYARYYSPTEMGQLYSRCKIVFNRSINGDLNMRAFEAMASGALLLTDRIENGLAELFTEDVHYVGYSSVEEAVQKIDRFLLHEDERRRIAEAGRLEVAGRHTYRMRLRRILARTQAECQRAAIVRSMSRAQVARSYARVFESLRRPKGVVQVARRYGSSVDVVLSFLRSLARAVNAVVPLSPAAIRARLGG